MISTDFAPNERGADAWVSIKLLFQPWRWKKGRADERVKYFLKKKFFPQNVSIFLYLTGRGALYFLLQSFKLPQQSEIIVQAFTCTAVILPILENKLHPVYVDIDRSTLSMNPQELEKKISPKTKVIILQHSFGITPDRESILAIAKKHNLIVIEDVAHGFEPSIFKKNTDETVKLLSFGRSKPFSSVFGGAVVTTNKQIATALNKVEKNLIMPSYVFLIQLLLYKPLVVFIKSTQRILIGKILYKIVRFLHILPLEISQTEKEGNFNHGLSLAYPNALGILLMEQFKHYDKIIDQRKKASTQYTIHFKPTNTPQLYDKSLLRYPVIVENRTAILKAAQKAHIGLGTWYTQVVDPKATSLRKMKYIKGSCPVAEEICQNILNLPTTVSETDTEKVLALF